MSKLSAFLLRLNMVWLSACAVAVISASQGVAAPLSPPLLSSDPYEHVWDSPEAKREEQRAAVQEAERAARRAGPEAQQRRDRSKRAHRDMGRAEALGLAKQLFPGVMDQPRWRLPELRAGERIKEFRGDRAFMLDRGNGPDSLVESPTPIRAVDDAGKQAPMDMTLESVDEGFVARNATEPVVLPAEAGDRAAFRRRDLQFHFVGANAVPGTVESGKVFYANALEDTDLMLAALPTGVESFAILRSELSPEDHALAFEVPGGGANLVDGGGGAVEVRRGDTTVARISPPAATDAEGVAVPVDYRLEGGTLVVHTEHQGGDWMYPILVDPIIEYEQPFSGDPGTWGWFAWNNNYGDQATYNHAGQGAKGYGLHQWFGQNRVYDNGRGGNFHFYSWRQSFIYRSEFGDTKHHDVGTRVGRGIYHPPTTGWGSSLRLDYGELAGGGWHVGCWYSDCRWDAPSSGTEQNFTFMSDWQGFRGADFPWAFLGGAYIFQYDDNNPVQSGADPLRNTWQRPGVVSSFSLKGTDAGLGIRTIALGTDRFGQKTSTYACNGDRGSRCPGEWSVGQYYNTNDQPEGKLNWYSYVEDVLTRQSPRATWWVGKDATPPTITSLSNGGIRPGTAVSGGHHTLRVDARDVGSGGAENSGVKRIEYQLDAGPWISASPNCATGDCLQTFPIDTSGMTEGSHRIETRVFDGVSYQSAQQGFDFTVDRSPADVTLSGDLWDARGQGLVQAAPQLTIEGSEAAAGSGVKSYEVLVDGARTYYDEEGACTATSCPRSGTRRWTYSQSAFTTGMHTIEVVLRDRAGNERRAPRFTVYSVRSERHESDGEPTYTDDGELGDGAGEADWCTPDDPEDAYCGEDDDENPTLRRALDEPALLERLETPLIFAMSANRDPATVAADETPAIGFGMGGQRDGAADAQGNAYDPHDDPRFRDLSLKRFRIVVPWNLAILPSGGQYTVVRRYFENLIDKIYAAGQEPLVAFGDGVPVADGDDTPGDDHLNDLNPPVATYSYGVKQFRLNPKFERIGLFTPWNEPNFVHRATGADPERAARYWNRVDRQCNRPKPDENQRRCVPVAGDVLDNYTLTDRRFERTPDTAGDPKWSWWRTYKSALAHKPKVWSIHAYQTARYKTEESSGINQLGRFRAWMKSTRATAGRTPNRVWVTEVGGVIRVGNVLRGDAVENEAEARRLADNDFDWALRALPALVDDISGVRLTRIYQYNWVGSPRFDTGLLEHDPDASDFRANPTRAMYDTFKRVLADAG